MRPDEQLVTPAVSATIFFYILAQNYTNVLASTNPEKLSRVHEFSDDALMTILAKLHLCRFRKNLFRNRDFFFRGGHLGKILCDISILFATGAILGKKFLVAILDFGKKIFGGRHLGKQFFGSHLGKKNFGCHLGFFSGTFFYGGGEKWSRHLGKGGGYSSYARNCQTLYYSPCVVVKYLSPEEQVQSTVTVCIICLQ